MPTYEYVCTSCRSPLEIVQSIHEPSITDCPSCEDGRLRKVFGNVGVVFKGSGFYRTDSRSKPTAGSTPTPKTDSKESKKTAAAAATGSTGTAPGATPGAGQGSNGSTGPAASSPKAAAAAAS